MKKEVRESIIEKASKQVGPGVFYSTIVVIASFLPVFMLTGMEGKMFHPLAYTKTFILLVDAILAIGVIVDDSIVMVENSYRRLANESIKTKA